MKKYIIRKISDSSANRIEWQSLDVALINCYPWTDNGYKPLAEVRLAYSSTNLHVFLKAYESEVKAVYTQTNDPVYKDSCMEFFFNPVPHMGNNYMNIEMNCIGTYLIGLGTCRYDRKHIEELPADIKASLANTELTEYKGPYWTLEYNIPFDFIAQYFGKEEFKSGDEMRANFYKCGNDTSEPHYGCWNPIENLRPDFHRPEYFGLLVFE